MELVLPDGSNSNVLGRSQSGMLPPPTGRFVLHATTRNSLRFRLGGTPYLQGTGPAQNLSWTSHVNPDMARCPSCHGDVEPGQSVCGHCGAPLPTGPGDSVSGGDGDRPDRQPGTGEQAPTQSTGAGGGTARRTLLKAGLGGLASAGVAGGAWFLLSGGGDGVGWPTYFGGPGNRRFVSGAAGPVTEPGDAVKATVSDRDFTPMVALIDDGQAWNVGLSRVSLGDGSVATGGPSDARPVALTDEGVVAAIAPADRRELALFDHSLSRQWRTPVPDTYSPVTGDGALYVGSQDAPASVRALALSDGSTRWEYDLEGSLGGLAYADGTVYLASADDAGPFLAAIDSRTGAARRLWQYTGREATGMVFSIPVVADGTVYLWRVQAYGGSPPPPALFAVDAADGTTRWTVEHTTSAMPVVTDDLVYLLGRAYDPASPCSLWTRPMAASFGAGRSARPVTTSASSAIDSSSGPSTARSTSSRRAPGRPPEVRALSPPCSDAGTTIASVC